MLFFPRILYFPNKMEQLGIFSLIKRVTDLLPADEAIHISCFMLVDSGLRAALVQSSLASPVQRSPPPPKAEIGVREATPAPEVTLHTVNERC